MTEPNKKIKLEYNPEIPPDNLSNNLENAIKDVLQNIQREDQLEIKREIILAEPDFSMEGNNYWFWIWIFLNFFPLITVLFHQ